MELQKVSFEIAKLLKEKGFDWKTLSRYQDNEDKTIGNVLYNYNCIEEQKLWNTGLYSAPEIDLVVKWLREAHNFHIVVNIGIYQEFQKNYMGYYSNAIKFGKHHKSKFKSVFYKTYEQTQEQVIIECLKLI